MKINKLAFVLATALSTLSLSSSFAYADHHCECGAECKEKECNAEKCKDGKCEHHTKKNHKHKHEKKDGEAKKD